MGGASGGSVTVSKLLVRLSMIVRREKWTGTLPAHRNERGWQNGQIPTNNRHYAVVPQRNRGLASWLTAER